MPVKLSDKASVKSVLTELTLEEKARLVSGGGIYTTEAIERLGIPSALMIDAGSGVNFRQYLEAAYDLGIVKDSADGNDGTEGIGAMARFGNIANNLMTRENLSDADSKLLDAFLEYIKSLTSGNEYPSCFPTNTLLAATWNPETVYSDACAVGREAAAFGVDVLLGTPCINIQRDPRGGRGFENYSEDPYLTAELAACFAKGVQEQGIIADVKHFAANNQETDRMRVNEIIPERALYEIYFPAFKACVQKGGAKNVMAAYNWINGEACALNKWLLSDVLRGEWGFEGFVVSDWRASYDFVKAVQAGTDLTMPGPRDPQEIIEAVNNGSLAVSDIDKAVEHFLGVLIDMPTLKGRKYTTIDTEFSRKTAYDVATEGITLLRNQDNILPLNKDAHVAFFGDKCHKMHDCGVGSGHVYTNKTSSLIARTEEIVGRDNLAVNEIRDNTDVVVVTVATDGQEGGDCPNMCLKSQDIRMLHELLEKTKATDIKVILLLNIAGPVEMMDFIGSLDAVLNVYYPGQEGARAAADILFGLVNPSGKLPQTFPKHYRDCPSYGNFPGYNEKVYYGEGIYVGYRWYDTRHIEPLFPFGFGLSYTTFEFRDLRLSSDTFNIDKNDKLTATVRITNTGKVFGKEVVQFYVKDVASTLDKPEKELKGFQKIGLAPGESIDVAITIDKTALSSFDTRLHEWICEPGDFIILVGNSSRNILAEAGFRAVGFNSYAYGKNTPIIKLSMDVRAVEVILNRMPKDSITETEFFNAAYFGQRHSLEVVWNTILSKYIAASDDEKAIIFSKIWGDLEKIDASCANLIEKFVF